ncbi:helix-turn-helix domain-containing protein [Flavobacterium magnum]|nr:helix-turn-helix transcriptional regulator [Flavobacterium magnum]
MKQTTPLIDIGNMIRQHMDKKRASLSELGRVIGKDSSTINYYLRSASLPSDTLLILSHALKHNFFADVAALLPETYTTTAPPDTSKDETIALLQRQIEILQAEKALLVGLLEK